MPTQNLCLIAVFSFFAFSASAEKTFPPQSPMFFYHLAEACYRNAPQRYVTQALGTNTVELLHHASVGKIAKWDFFLWLDHRSKTAVVSFQGTRALKNWGNNFVRVIKPSTRLYKQMGRQIHAWQDELRDNDLGEIIAFVGHSRGGDFAMHVNKDWNVYRITFNGYDCRADHTKKDNRIFNLRMKGDIISLLPPKKKGAYFSLKQSRSAQFRTRDKVLQRSHYLFNFAKQAAQAPSVITVNWLVHPHKIPEKTWQDLLAQK